MKNINIFGSVRGGKEKLMKAGTAGKPKSASVSEREEIFVVKRIIKYRIILNNLDTSFNKVPN